MDDGRRVAVVAACRGARAVAVTAFISALNDNEGSASQQGVGDDTDAQSIVGCVGPLPWTARPAVILPREDSNANLTERWSKR